MRTPLHYSAGKDPAIEDDKNDDDDDEWEDWPQDEIGMSQLGGALLGTQGASQVLTKVVSLNT